MAIGGIPRGVSGASATPPTPADALAGLKTGDVITARVQQAVANTARLAIGRAVIDVLTQVALKPGTTVSLQVQRSDSGVTLQVVQPDAGQGQQAPAQTARPLPAAAQQPQAPQGGQSPAPPPAPPTAQPAQPQPPSGAAQQSAPRPAVPTPSGASQQPVIVQTTQTGAPAPTVSANQPQVPANAANPSGTAQPGVPAQTPPTATGPQPAQPGVPSQAGTPAQSGTLPPSGQTPAVPTGSGAPAPTPGQVTVATNQAGAPPQAQPATGANPAAQNAVTPQPASPGNVAPQPATPLAPQAQQPVLQGGSGATPSANASPGPQASSSAQKTPQTQQVQLVQTLATARVQAASVQIGLAPVFSNLEAVLNQPGRPQLEPSLEAAARQLLGLKVPSEKLAEPAGLRNALRASGPYLEATLARGLPPPEGDLKNALLVLRNVLKNVFGDVAKLPATGVQTHPAPEQASNPQAQRPALPALPQGADATEIMRQLAADTEGALARVRLLQIASLADADGVPRQDGAPENQPRVWQMEVPIGTGRETSVMAIRIERDKRVRKDERDGPVWRVKLALELEEAGAISAAIAYSPPQVSVSIWAEQPETSQMLKENAGTLDDALRAAELDVDGIDVQTGRAPETKRSRSPQPAGGLFDREG